MEKWLEHKESLKRSIDYQNKRVHYKYNQLKATYQDIKHGAQITREDLDL